MKNNLIDIKSFSINELVNKLKELGEPSFRANQIFEWLYGGKLLGISSFDQMTNLSLSLREKLSSQFFINMLIAKQKHVSKDGTIKYVFVSNDGTRFETVVIPETKQNGQGSNDKLTVCVSSQAGCKMNCSFCATGKQKFYRNLNIGEVVDQALYATQDIGKRISNIVVMGQGEPFQNYDSVINAIKICNDKKYLNIGARKITVSTCGIVKGINAFSKESEQFGLAVSLHSCIQNTRNVIMPGVKSQPLSVLRRSVIGYIKATNRRPTFEYMLLEGINDSKKDLEALVKFCEGLLCHVNLLKYNKVDGCEYYASSSSTMNYWKQQLEAKNIAVSIRESRGEDIAGACGQLIENK